MNKLGGLSNGSPFLLRHLYLVVLLACGGCATATRPSEALDPFVLDLPATLASVSEQIGSIIQYEPFLSHLEARHSSVNKLVTAPKGLTMKQLKKWADPHGNAPSGRPIKARMTIEFQLREQIAGSNRTRLIIKPIFEVYISSWGDRRQWVEWMSNGAVEAIIEARLLSGE